MDKKEYETLKVKFLRSYANLLDSLRNQIIVVFDKKTYTWNSIYFEVKGDTKLAEKLLNTLKEIGVI